MDDLARFTTTAGEDVILDLSGLIACWEGTEPSPDTIVFNLMGLDEPVEVVGNFEEFVTDWLDYYDCRQSKKKPCRKQQGSIVKIATVRHSV